jgi:DNA adenine methylase
MKPFLKWAGGKYRLVSTLKEHFLPNHHRFIEPFFGSGAVSLNVDYPEFLVGDTNKILIDTWIHLRHHQQSFIDECKELFDLKYNTPKAYNSLREEFNSISGLQNTRTSALFIYLNRHGFNGLCRFNKSGGFNVPFGKYNNPYFPEKEMLHAVEVSKKMEIRWTDFRTIFQKVKAGDLVYCDPPYVPLTDTANFTAYTADGFSMKDHADLASCAREAALRGAVVFISNHDTPIVRNLYMGARIHEIEVQRNISCKGEKREKVKEIIAVF